MFPEKERFAPWKRYLLGSLLMILVAMSVSAMFAFGQRQNLAETINERAIRNISKWLDGNPGGSRTILLIGSDVRKKGADKNAGQRSDTMMLVRLDPDLAVTSVLSLPRDLKVTIPGVGVDKLNAAYSYGGTRLALRTIKDVTGLKVNHVVNIDFKGFRQAVDRIGCVYIDVDHRYYNDNTNLVVAAQYATINIKPGYQKICGKRSLDYVRYRHGDDDVIRGARQQGFLRQSRQQVGLRELFTNAKALKRIVARNTRTDASLGDGKTLQQVLTLAVKSAGKPIWQVQIPNYGFENGAQTSYVVASGSAMRKVRREFLNGPKIKASASTGASGSAAPTKKQSRSRYKAGQVKGIIDATSEGQLQANQVRQDTSMSVYYPKVKVSGSRYEIPRGYKIELPKGKPKSAYRIVARTNDSGEYYGIQGTKWLSPPILEGSNETRKVGGRTLLLYWEGTRLGLVVWKRKNAIYWVSNTVTRKLSSKQMLAIATSLKLAR